MSVLNGGAFLEAILPPYFSVWNEIVSELDLDSWELPRADNPEYCTKLMEYLKDHQHEQAESRAILPGAEQVRIVAVEVGFVEAIGLVMEDLENINWHWSVKASMDSQWRLCWYTPAATTLYGLWDHMASFVTAEPALKPQPLLHGFVAFCRVLRLVGAFCTQGKIFYILAFMGDLHVGQNIL